MRSSLALRSTITATETEIGRELARRNVDLLLSIDGPYALVRCHVSSAVAAAMLAPLKGKAAGQVPSTRRQPGRGRRRGDVADCDAHVEGKRQDGSSPAAALTDACLRRAALSRSPCFRCASGTLVQRSTELAK